ncbi:hypothetical protein SAMN04488107_0038 [Geodermatophilus saharensis]|uniref:Uncharacterized protein n=1 Tax=Geodermatophilus saharensis TaxID=1137994 RepID=A0A238ZH57_9ACTN|nr:hypothetical protein [Geodermatophilus saharensis]SNR82004.1 hypothetical protein SAMN04488107_0038 [Geodermatophilus saharensis]
MAFAPVFFAKPDAGMAALEIAPRLASWEAAGHPDQVALRAFLDYAEAVFAPQLAQLSAPRALRLDVGLPQNVDLLDAHDLDNYGFPLAARLTQATGRSLASVWVTKLTGTTSVAAVQEAVPRATPSIGAPVLEVRTTASATTAAYKQQIHDQVHAALPPTGPVALELSFTVGPRRNWLNLWKPTIDALDALLGQAVLGQAWHPRDGRIVWLGLHQQVDDTLGDDVVVAIAATVPS